MIVDDLRQFHHSALGGPVAALGKPLLLVESGTADGEESFLQLPHTLKGPGSIHGLPEVSVALGIAERAPTAELTAFLERFPRS